MVQLFKIVSGPHEKGSGISNEWYGPGIIIIIIIIIIYLFIYLFILSNLYNSVYTFSEYVSPKLDFELAYDNVAVQPSKHNTIATSPN